MDVAQANRPSNAGFGLISYLLKEVLDAGGNGHQGMADRGAIRAASAGARQAGAK